MVKQVTPNTAASVFYPESDGQPMADNTKQYTWIVTIKENLEILFKSRDDVFIAGDLFWFPVEGDPDIRQAPDVLVVFGRPKGHRGSYKQWSENNIPPQVVFEILSPGNTTKEMANKFSFYQRHGVEEYYIYDPEKITLKGWLRSENILKPIKEINGWVSPHLGINFQMTPETLSIYYPDGRKFLTPVENDDLREQERREKEQERLEKEQERREKEQALQELEQERQRYQELLAQLRDRGINLEDL
ncbi:MAG: Uma2 family endonuclease [Scytonematopsis contorta HA4267-MV1]|jgi:Uma2 family endonuclease|nr:Uma2 family endonuclease [Scytonematopsis contorta HA4267-MV1]